MGIKIAGFFRSIWGASQKVTDNTRTGQNSKLNRCFYNFSYIYTIYVYIYVFHFYIHHFYFCGLPYSQESLIVVSRICNHKNTNTRVSHSCIQIFALLKIQTLDLVVVAFRLCEFYHCSVIIIYFIGRSISKIPL